MQSACVRLFALSFQFLLCFLSLFAEGTRTWEQSKFEELTKGTANGVAIRSEGGLELAPAFKALSTTPSTYIWSIAADREGNLYAAAGSPARVYRITPDGQSTAIFEPQELQVQALVVDKNGSRLRRHRIPTARSTKSSIMPAAARALTSKRSTDKRSNRQIRQRVSLEFLGLFRSGYQIHLGPRARRCRQPLRRHRRSRRNLPRHAEGRALRFLQERRSAHSRAGVRCQGQSDCRARTAAAWSIASRPSGEGFVLYSAPKKEITALAIDKAGNIYAAGVGEKHAGTGVQAFPLGNFDALRASPAESRIAERAS